MSNADFNKVFSKRLRLYMAEYNMTQAELAKKLSVGTTSVYNWYNGVKTPRMDKVDKMCEIFHCKRSDLIEDKPTPAAPSDVMDIVNQYGTDTPEQRAALSAALDAVDIPAEKRELIQRILKMEPKQVAEVLELLQLADRMRQQ